MQTSQKQQIQRRRSPRIWHRLALAIASFCLIAIASTDVTLALSPVHLNRPSRERPITATARTAIAQPPANPVPLAHPPLAAATLPADLLTQGKQFYEAGRFASALTAWQQADIAYAAPPDHLNQALSSSLLSLAHQALGDWQAAQAAIDRSLTLLESIADGAAKTTILAQVLNTQGSLQLALGQAETALETWQAAERAYTKLKDNAGVLGSQTNQAQALQSLGLFRRSQELLQQVEAQLQTQPASSLKAAALRSLGTVWQLSGNLPQAQANLEASLSIARQLNAPAEIAAALFSLGNTHRVLQNFDRALQSYQEAAATAPSLGDRLAAQVNLLSLLLQNQDRQTAQTLFTQEIQPQLRSLTPSRSTIYTQVHLATTLMEFAPIAPPETIATLLAQAIQQAQSIQDPRAESYAIGQLGALYEQTQQWQAAEKLTQQALLIAQSLDAADISYRWEWQLGRLRQRVGDRSGAIAAYTQSVELLRSLRSDLVAVNADVQFSFREKVEPVYRELVSLLVDDEKASQQELKQAREVIEALQLAELQNFFRSACLDARPSQIDQVDRSAATIYPILLPDRLTVILSVPGQPLTTYSTRVAQTQVEHLAEQALQSLNPIFSDQERLRIAQQLYDWLVRPAESLLSQSQVKTLVFVPDGALRNLPMAALYDGHHYLLERYSVAITPGLQLLEPRSLSDQERRQVLIGGLTEARQGFSALPGVATESNQIAAKVAADVLLNQAFTETNLQNQVQATSFPLVHLATHGQFSSKLEDTFILTWDNRVTIEGLRNLLQSRSSPSRNPIELLVLSACETAEGDQRATLGLAGLAVRSGARSTLATLWSVNDESTAEFMVAFYRSLTQQGMSKAESLRQAQLTLLNNPKYQHPFYWAPFILVGNWL